MFSEKKKKGKNADVKRGMKKLSIVSKPCCLTYSNILRFLPQDQQGSTLSMQNKQENCQFSSIFK